VGRGRLDSTRLGVDLSSASASASGGSIVVVVVVLLALVVVTGLLGNDGRRFLPFLSCFFFRWPLTSSSSKS